VSRILAENLTFDVICSCKEAGPSYPGSHIEKREIERPTEPERNEDMCGDPFTFLPARTHTALQLDFFSGEFSCVHLFARRRGSVDDAYVEMTLWNHVVDTDTGHTPLLAFALSFFPPVGKIQGTK